MQTYISMLRGINVSGHKMIKMEALRNLYTQLDFKNVQTYIQSGNVTFQTSESKPQDLQQKIANKVLEEFGFIVPVMVKLKSAFIKVIDENPFQNEDLSKLHVTFLSEIPKNENVLKIASTDYAPDKIAILENSVYIICPNGYGNTKLNNTFLEKKLKVIATTRNWKTINELFNIADKISNH
jgi:uncharacterized protein (DUF1697 family)